MRTGDAAGQAIKDAIADLFTFFNRGVDVRGAAPYIRVLEKYSPAVIRAAVERAKESRRFLPKPVELRSDADACRAEELRSRSYEACEVCRAAGTPGWLPTTDAAGVVRVARCACWHAYAKPASEPTTTRSTSTATGGWSDAPELSSNARQRFRVVGEE